MEGSGEHLGFFRVRTSFVGPANRGALWLVGSLAYIDFSYKEMVIEVATIGMVTNGTFSYQDCANMPWEQYEYLRVEIDKAKAKNHGS